MDIEKLLTDYIKARHDEALAIERRVALGNQIADRLGAPDEGRTTHKACGFKVTIKQPVNRRVTDWEEFKKVAFHHEHPPMRMKPSLDVKGLKWLQENEPATYRQFAKFVEAKPGRVAVEVDPEK